MKRFLLLVTVLTLLLTLNAAAQTRLQGTWTAHPSSDDSTKLQIDFHHHRNSQTGDQLPISDFTGLTTAAIQGETAPVKFSLQREEGTIQFSGEFGKGQGAGTFDFTANPDYLAAMKQLGYRGVEEQAFALMVIDVNRAFESEIRGLGYHPKLDDLVAARIFRVGREQVEGLKSVGITGLPLDKLVEFKIFDINPEYIREQRAAYPGISQDRLVELRIHKVTPEFAREMAANGYANLSLDQLVAFRIHGVTPEFIREVRDMGFKDMNADKLVEFRIFHVDKQQVSELAKEGYSGLTADQLVAFRIHKVDPTFIEKVKKAGFSHPSPDKLIEFRIMGIRRAASDGDDDI